MDKNNTVIFQEFARKAKQRIEEKKKKRTKKLYIGDLDMELTIRGISDEEYEEITEMNLSEINRDKYLVYYVCPELQEAASIMVEEGSLAESSRYRIVDMFRTVDRTAICREILALSGLTGESSVEEAEKRFSEADEVKN